MDRRLEEHGIAAGKEMRAKYRTLLFSTPNLERTISGIILAEDTFQDHAIDGVPTRDYLAHLGIVVGVKVDGGLVPYNEDKVLKRTIGLEGLQKRCASYKERGAGFLKWRSAIPAIGVTDNFITTVVSDMVEYASHALEHGLVPILEPEILLEGSHTAEDTAETFKRTLSALLTALTKRGCDPHHCILKTSFIIDGLDREEVSAEEVAKKTLITLKEAGLDTGKSFYGVVFLSGGLESKRAINYIQQIKAFVEQEGTEHSFAPPITFSYARALQEPVLAVWKGEEENALVAQLAFTQTLQLAVKKYKGLEEAPLAGDGKEV